MNIPLQQTKLWQNFQTALGEKSTFEKNKDYQFLAIEKSTPLGTYLFVPYGPVAKTKTGLSSAYKALEALATTKKAMFIRVEPQSPLNRAILKNLHAKKSHDLDPADTWILDLNPETLTEKLPSRLLRYHRTAEKKGITVETSKNPDDIKHLVELQSALAEAKNLGTFPEKYFKTQLAQPFATLYLVKQSPIPSPTPTKNPANPKKSTPEILAAGLIFDDETTRYNIQGAQSLAGARAHATGILTIQLIFDAAAKNLKTFDFWGIAPDGADKTHPWAGFTNFKKSFAGTPVHYCGTYDIIKNPLKYRAYQSLRTLNRLKRKIKK